MIFSRTQSRRLFLSHLSKVGALCAAAPLCVSATQRRSADDKLNIGIIGVAHQGQYNLSNVATENIVALCDVDEAYLAAAKGKFPGAETYVDFRKLLDRNDLDAVVIATPDHTHAAAAVRALESGLHVYCEKPLTRTLSECRAVMDAARKSGKATQLGTQIHAGENYRRVVELVQAGAVGEISEVHVWVNAVYGLKPRPEYGKPCPSELHYDLWVGPVADGLPYSPDFVPRQWRNWWSYGGGSLADFGCHFMDLPHWALGLAVATSAEILEGPAVSELAVPPWMVLRYEYQVGESRRQMPLTWYHGGKKPHPDVLPPDLAEKWSNGVLFIGSRGKILADYGRRMLLPESEFAGYPAPVPSIPPSIGHHAEWIHACKTGASTTCNFGYSGALTESVLLGNLAYRLNQKVKWNSRKLQADNCKRAAKPYIQHQYRKGWKL